MISGFRPCTIEDFNNRSYFPANTEKYESRYCPDIINFEDDFKIQNSYANAYNRTAFSLEIELCTNKTGHN